MFDTYYDTSGHVLLFVVCLTRALFSFSAVLFNDECNIHNSMTPYEVILMPYVNIFQGLIKIMLGLVL